MRYGEQYDNTYHLGDDGQVISHSFDDRGRPSTEPTEGRTEQGMLFGPETATGRKDDPLVSSDERIAAIEDAYGLDKESHAARFQSVSGEKSVGARKAENARKIAIDSIYNSGIPIHEMRNDRNPKVVASPSSKGVTTGRAGGFYFPGRDLAYSNIETFRTTERRTVNVPTAGDGTWIDNPKPMDMREHRFYGFGDWEEGRADESNMPQPPTEAQMANHKAKKREVKQQRKDWKELAAEHGEEYRDFRGDTELRIPADKARELKQSGDLPPSLQDMGSYDLTHKPSKPYSPKKRYADNMESWQDRRLAREEHGIEEHQLYSQPAPEHNEKIYSQKIGEGYKYLVQGGDTDTEYWGRQKATEWEPQELTIHGTKRGVRESTMVHEIGHGRHLQGRSESASNRSYNRRADPLEEGMADAYADRNAGSGQPTSRADLRDQIQNGGGYGTDYRGWSNNTERALYAATRAISARGQEKDIAWNQKQRSVQEQTGREGSRGEGQADLDFINSSNVSALGKIMSENPDLHEELFSDTSDKHWAGMAEAATTAQQTYERGVERQKLAAAGNPVERQLPFGAWYGTRKQQEQGLGYGIRPKHLEGDV